ncbi:hypothetical protein J2S94_003978 [Arthrobacter bambusae]|nr:hypothetical protein [Arthrobacter bambusae]
MRRDWIKTLLARKTAPKGWQYFTVHAITHHPEVISGYDGKVAAGMIGAKFEDRDRWAWNPLRDHVAAGKARPEISLIAPVCAGYEKAIVKDSWRSDGGRCGQPTTTWDPAMQRSETSTNTSRRGRSNSEAAVEPTGRPAFTNMPIVRNAGCALTLTSRTASGTPQLSLSTPTVFS